MYFAYTCRTRNASLTTGFLSIVVEATMVEVRHCTVHDANLLQRICLLAAASLDHAALVQAFSLVSLEVSRFVFVNKEGKPKCSW